MTPQELNTERLTGLLKDGEVLYGINHKTTGNSDIVQVLYVHNGRIEDLTRRIACACQFRLAKKGIVVKGSGFGKVQAIAEEVERVTGKKVTGQSISTNQK